MSRTTLLPDRARAVIALISLAPVIVVVAAGSHHVMPAPAVHFWLVAAAAGLAAVASASLTVAGARAGDGRSVLLGAAFSTMTALLTVHGLATPGMIVGPNGVIAAAGGLSIPIGSALLALTALPALRRPRRVRPLLALQAVGAALVLTLGALGLAAPQHVPAVPAAGTPLAKALVAFGVACLTLLVVRAARTHALTRRRADALVVVGCAWLGFALWGQLVVGPMTVAYYFGHVLEIGAVALIGIPAALDLRRHGASRPLSGDLSATELVASEEAYLGPRVRSLLVALGERDESTAEHTRRVALLAAAVAEDLRLPAAARRRLAMGGLLHDVGKLSVPLAILRKPGPLDDAEYAEIKRHPGSGRALLEELGGFPEPVLRLVCDHHERLDGKGYPHGLSAEDLDLETRILTACDVYDALVSNRVYRAAWSPERALGLLRDETGTAFDGGVVAALERVLGPAEQAVGWVARLADAAGATAAAPSAPAPARRPA
jgi:HD-GYP domain-containing protein (c-di-GMP phosphodiesterase class II)